MSEQELTPREKEVLMHIHEMNGKTVLSHMVRASGELGEEYVRDELNSLYRKGYLDRTEFMPFRYIWKLNELGAKCVSEISEA